MSRQAIAAALARDDVAGGERLVAFSLASFAGASGRAWPGSPAAAARAGLSRSRYLHDRDRLVSRGLVEIAEKASGRGRATTVVLLFAEEGPWWEGDINPELFEAVLSRSRTRGSARLLLAAMAALAEGDGTVRGLSNEELCSAAGLDDRTYRRARPQLVSAGELLLINAARGRGNTNVWQVRTPVCEAAGGPHPSQPRRVSPPPGARPLVASVTPTASPDGLADRVPPLERSVPNRPVLTGVSAEKGGQRWTVSVRNRPASPRVSAVKGGRARTLFELPPGEYPAQNPAENSAALARAGNEPQNPRTDHPPDPPEGGSPTRWVYVEQAYVTARGRTRRRAARVDLDELRRALGRPGAIDRVAWQEIRALLEAAIGETTFGIWLAPLALIAVDDRQTLVLAVPSATASWTRARFGRLIANAAVRVGRAVRFATEQEMRALEVTEQQGEQLRKEAAR